MMLIFTDLWATEIEEICWFGQHTLDMFKIYCVRLPRSIFSEPGISLQWHSRHRRWHSQTVGVVPSRLSSVLVHLVPSWIQLNNPRQTRRCCRYSFGWLNLSCETDWNVEKFHIHTKITDLLNNSIMFDCLLFGLCHLMTSVLDLWWNQRGSRL